jgi:hypothetical protein
MPSARGKTAPRWQAAVPFLGPVTIVAVAFGMLARTWLTWPDPLVDYGREVYLAWQVAQGKMLYADLVHFNGPFSTYLNGVVIRLFGPGIVNLAVANAALTAGCVAMLYGLFVRIADRLAATLAGLVFVTVFFCSRYVRLGNYTWLCPYSYELTHGIALAIAALWCLDRYHRTRWSAWLAATGAAMGLVALTKAEALLAGGLAMATGLVLTFWIERPRPARLLRLLGCLAAGLVVPLGATVLFFVRRMPMTEVLRWPLGYWHAASRPEFVAMPFYRQGLGIDDVAGNLRTLATALAWDTVALLPGLVAALVLRHVPQRRAASIVLGLGSFVAARWLVSIDGWLRAVRPLPLALLVAVGASLVACVRARADVDRPRVLRAALSVFALALLAKMVLNVRVFHYGFALAMPATLVVVVALVTWVPSWRGRRGLAGDGFRAVAIGVILAGVVAHVAYGDTLLARQTSVIGDGADAFYGDDRVAPLSRALAEIRRRVAPDQTLVALPEGIMLAYLARRASSLPYIQYNPVSVLLWGEERIAQDFQTRPPDFVLLVHRDNAHEGARFFGRDYAQRVMRFVDAEYHAIWQTGALPLRDERFGILLLERRTSGTAAAADGAP